MKREIPLPHFLIKHHAYLYGMQRGKERDVECACVPASHHEQKYNNKTHGHTEQGLLLSVQRVVRARDEVYF